jgi:hypothetical protein
MRKREANQASRSKGRMAIMVLCGLTAMALCAAFGGGAFAGFKSEVECRSLTANKAESRVMELPYRGCGNNQLMIYHCEI